MCHTFNLLCQQRPQSPTLRRGVVALLWMTAFLLIMSVANAESIIRIEGSQYSNDVDRVLDSIFADINHSRLERALDSTDDLIKAHPDFLLGHLIRGDLLMAKAKNLKNFGGAALIPSQKQRLLRELHQEARARINGFRHKPDLNKIPELLLQFSPEQKNAIIVDANQSRLYLYGNDNGKPRLITDYYATLGKEGVGKLKEGDKKTPLGVFHVTSRIPAERLPPRYGGVALPINYPNVWDKLNDRSGYGIWLHGTPPGTFSRPPNASDGCVALSNEDIRDLAEQVDDGNTPVLISSSLNFMQQSEWEQKRATLNAALERWRRDWESQQADKFLAHYSTAFRNDREDYKKFAQNKSRIIPSKKWISVRIKNISIYKDPSESDMYVINFDQNFKSDNYSSTTHKQQYWQLIDGRWQIVVAHEIG